MKTDPKMKAQKKALMLGEFITGIYDACGQHKATGIVRLAAKAHWIEFRGRDRSLVS